MRMNPFYTSATSGPLAPATDDDRNDDDDNTRIYDSKAASGMKIDIGNRITRIISALMPV